MRRLRIFISSPGDVQKERQVAQRIIARLAAEFADRVALDPYFWEYEPMRLTAGFQAQIPALPISISSYASCGRGSERRCSIVLAPMGAAGVVAFDWASKAELWRSPNGFPVTTSPVPVKLTQGDAQGVLVAAITGDLWLLSLEDGKPLWRRSQGDRSRSGRRRSRRQRYSRHSHRRL